MSAKSQQIPIIDKMMEILGYLEFNPQGATLTELCQQLSIPKTTTFRILRTLADHRVLHSSEESKRYVLGPRLVALAAAVKGMDILAISRPVMESLSERLSETTKLTVPADDGVVVIAVTQSPTGFGIFSQVGRRFPYHAGAASKVCLAHRSETFLSSLAAKGLMSYTESTITNPAALSRELSQIRDNGWAIDNEEYVKGVIAIAAPIFDSSNQLTAALSVTFLAAKNERERAEARDQVIKGARAISQELGARASNLATSGAEG